MGATLGVTQKLREVKVTVTPLISMYSAVDKIEPEYLKRLATQFYDAHKMAKRNFLCSKNKTKRRTIRLFRTVYNPNTVSRDKTEQYRGVRNKTCFSDHPYST